MTKDSLENRNDRLFERATRGDDHALGDLLDLHRDRLNRMVRLRMDQRLRGRIDPSDVIQEACLEASQRFVDYKQNPQMPFFLWLRFLTSQRLLMMHRRHFGAQSRDVVREVSLERHLPQTSSVVMVEIVSQRTSPSEAAAREEMKMRLAEALDALTSLDREVISLRLFEHLNNHEVALELGIEESAASKRYIRALRRLREAIADIPGGEKFFGEWT